MIICCIAYDVIFSYFSLSWWCRFNLCLNGMNLFLITLLLGQFNFYFTQDLMNFVKWSLRKDWTSSYMLKRQKISRIAKNKLWNSWGSGSSYFFVKRVWAVIDSVFTGVCHKSTNGRLPLIYCGLKEKELNHVDLMKIKTEF